MSGIPDFVEQIGYIDILINNAGVMNSQPYDNYPYNKMERLMNVNLYAPIQLISLFSKYMKSKKTGRIVNTASIAG